MMRNSFSLFILMFCCQYGIAQKLKLNNKNEGVKNVTDSIQYITGQVNPTDIVTVNNLAVKVYKTGAFVFDAKCKLGQNEFSIKVLGTKNKVINATVKYNYALKKPAQAIINLNESIIKIEPAENSKLTNGDNIIFNITTLTNTIITLPNGETIPQNDEDNNPQNYKLIYSIKEADSNWCNNKWSINFTNKTNNFIYSLPNSITYLPNKNYFYVRTKGSLPFLKESLGEDRLGSPRIGYIDTGIVLKVIGQIGDNYKVALNNNHIAFIETGFCKPLRSGGLALTATTTWRCYGDDKYDYVQIGLQQKLPYKSKQTLNAKGNVLEIDIYGAYNNTNWMTKITSAKEVLSADYEQMEKDHYKIRIQLKSKLFWGHSIYYKGNTLIIRIRQKPKQINLSNLTIGVDAGHGGSNNGALGISGAYEKDVTVAILNKLIDKLSKEGTAVIASRTIDKDVKNEDRLKLFLTTMPHLVISIHCNSAGGNPLRVSGTSTYYKFSGFANLSNEIYTQMLSLGLKEFGHVGNFNFILNSATDWPNALVETAFISNPEDEEKLLDEAFQNKIADQIIKGIKAWLAEEN